jgi:hypothetical protein
MKNAKKTNVLDKLSNSEKTSLRLKLKVLISSAKQNLKRIKVIDSENYEIALYYHRSINFNSKLLEDIS